MFAGAPDHVVVLFGSRARGDSDASSDEDVLVVADVEDPQTIAPSVTGLGLVHHRWSDLYRMCSYGSLFMLHLKLEGRVLGGNARGRLLYDVALAELKDYTRVERDLLVFKQALCDSRLALEGGCADVHFELSNVATVCRHASILGCYLLSLSEQRSDHGL